MIKGTPKIYGLYTSSVSSVERVLLTMDVRERIRTVHRVEKKKKVGPTRSMQFVLVQNTFSPHKKKYSFFPTSLNGSHYQDDHSQTEKGKRHNQPPSTIWSICIFGFYYPFAHTRIQQSGAENNDMQSTVWILTEEWAVQICNRFICAQIGSELFARR